MIFLLNAYVKYKIFSYLLIHFSNHNFLKNFLFMHLITFLIVLYVLFIIHFIVLKLMLRELNKINALLMIFIINYSC